MARTSVEDPRYRRVQHVLINAVLDLAGRMPAESISVADLAAAAGVSRTTFYARAASPAALLSAHLIGELRPQLDTLAEQMSQPDADYVGLWRRIYLALLEHVAEHRAVYEVITAHESAVSAALTAYFEEAAQRYLDVVTARLEGPPASDLWVAMAVNQQAHTMIAVIHAWVGTGMVDPPEHVVDVYLTLAPPWQLARPDAAGRISLRRSRSYRIGRRGLASDREEFVDASTVSIPDA